MSELLLDRAGRRRSPATMPGFHTGRPPRNKGLRYPADPPKVEEIVAVMRTAGGGAHARRLRGLIAILWRAGLRIQEALSLAEADLDHRRGALHVRNGKGGRRREVGMDEWGWEVAASARRAFQRNEHGVKSGQKVKRHRAQIRLILEPGHLPAGVGDCRGLVVHFCLGGLQRAQSDYLDLELVYGVNQQGHLDLKEHLFLPASLLVA